MKGRQAAAVAAMFDGWYGELYDRGAQSGGLAAVAALALWGFDLRRVQKMMRDGIACQAGQVVIDVPTGGGVSFVSGAKRTRGLLVGVDRSRGMLGRAQARRPRGAARSRVVLVRADATSLPLADGSVDRVLCFNSLHCLPLVAQRQALVEFRRVLRPDGELVGTTLVDDAAAPWRAAVWAAGLSGLFNPPTTRWLARTARRAGFSRWRQELSGALLYFGGQ